MDAQFKKDVLKEMNNRLVEYGLTMQMIEDEESGIPTLRCGFILPNEDADPMIMDMNFYDMDGFNIMQFYIYVNEATALDRVGALRKVADEVNAVSPVGQMGFFGEDRQFYYRHSMVLSDEETIEQIGEKAEDVIELMFMVLTTNYDRLMKIHKDTNIKK